MSTKTKRGMTKKKRPKSAKPRSSKRAPKREPLRQVVTVHVNGVDLPGLAFVKSEGQRFGVRGYVRVAGAIVGESRLFPVGSEAMALDAAVHVASRIGRGATK